MPTIARSSYLRRKTLSDTARELYESSDADHSRPFGRLSPALRDYWIMRARKLRAVLRKPLPLPQHPGKRKTPVGSLAQKLAGVRASRDGWRLIATATKRRLKNWQACAEERLHDLKAERNQVADLDRNNRRLVSMNAVLGRAISVIHQAAEFAKLHGTNCCPPVLMPTLDTNLIHIGPDVSLPMTPTAEAARAVAKHIQGVKRPESGAIVKATGIQFGSNCWISHARIMEDLAPITRKAYAEWVVSVAGMLVIDDPATPMELGAGSREKRAAVKKWYDDLTGAKKPSGQPFMPGVIVKHDKVPFKPTKKLQKEIARIASETIISHTRRGGSIRR